MQQSVTALERAHQRALARDEDFGPGNSRAHKFSIASITNDVVVARAAKLGVSLGKSPNEVANSESLIKDTEFHRTLTILKKVDLFENQDKEDTSNLVLHKAKYLSE